MRASSPRHAPGRWTPGSTLMATLFLAACAPGPKPMTHAQLTDFATRYAAAWSSQNPDSLAGFYTPQGSLTVNAGTPALGRPAVRAIAQGFMSAFPDMVVQLDSVTQNGNKATFYWLWTGTNSGPGGTGKAVRMTGFEEWTFAPDGLIAQSLGHYDEAEYQRQLREGFQPAP